MNKALAVGRKAQPKAVPLGWGLLHHRGEGARRGSDSLAYRGEQAMKKEKTSERAGPNLRLKEVAATYSPTLVCSTIGAGGLNFSVRDGKRWDPAAITALMS